MARIRSIKPELRTDLDVASWPIPARYGLVLLFGYLDDSGRGIDDNRLLVADLFPLDRDVTEKKLATWKKLWVDGGMVCLYQVDGTRYLHAVKWDRHQRINRPTPSRIPPCPTHGPSVNDSVSPSVNGSRNGSVNRSPQDTTVLSEPSRPRAQARVPAEQGAGSREQGAREQGRPDSLRSSRTSEQGDEVEVHLDPHQRRPA